MSDILRSGEYSEVSKLIDKIECLESELATERARLDKMIDFYIPSIVPGEQAKYEIRQQLDLNIDKAKARGEG